MEETRTTITMAQKLMSWAERIVLGVHVSIPHIFYVLRWGCRGDSRISISQNSKVITLDIAETQKDVFPAITAEKVDISFPAILIYSVRSIYEV